ncbi:MAG TPA: hypothetical protein VFW52_03230 [Candidatus Saccharimonadales bacterium]|nr:hypothetical protein [Candidatus Saccharimonadales bacterium]
MHTPESSQPLTGGTFEAGPPVNRAISGGRAAGSVPENSYFNFELKSPPEVLERQLEEQEGALWRSSIAHSIGRTALDVKSEEGDGTSDEENQFGESGNGQKKEPRTQTGESGGGDKPPEPPETSREFGGEESEDNSWWNEELWSEPKKAIWHGPAEDLEVLVIGSYGTDPNGDEYLKIEGMGHPAKAKDIEFIGTEPKTDSSQPTLELTPEIIKKAEEAGIPLESVKLALSHGYETPVETLVNAREYPPLRDIFERMGFALEARPTSQREDEEKRLISNSEYAKDPYMAQLEQGINARDRVVELDAAIREHPRKVKKTLKRPGAFALRIIPIIGKPAARYVLAWQIYGKEKQRRHEVKKVYADSAKRYTELKKIQDRSPDQELELKILDSSLPDLEKKANMQYHDGFMGLNKRRLYSAKIKAHDQAVVTAKGKLGPFEAKKYQSDEAPSRRHVLAEQILTIERQSLAFKNRLLNPIDSYDSDEFRNEVKKARGERYPGATALRRKLENLPPEPD